ncbi:tumor necrosis factor receptor superfamily member 5 [Lampris incognitus]|uniref:tumor necrosis factor receptor superfamily member 5 n=1 Tax=Lampris incognitus TaxID=2546036 RepID=UPI0024B4E45B|nr:tumor necrosis factor receptor superfamily member 5 [Lampris incognitus]
MSQTIRGFRCAKLIRKRSRSKNSGEFPEMRQLHRSRFLSISRPAGNAAALILTATPHPRTAAEETLGSGGRLGNMHLIVKLLFVVVSAAALSCDPQTQYEGTNGRCCQKCGPGTRMLHTEGPEACSDPNCQSCEDNEYQDGYTAEKNCNLQPYCDPNKNFEVVPHVNKKSQRSCICKTGYHCSNQACMTCAPHSPCQPGYEVQFKGNHSHDTVCQKCRPGTFSTETSEDAYCKGWTVCLHGSHEEMKGTTKSDTICGDGHREHIIVYVIPICILLVVAMAFGIYKAKGIAKRQVKKCMELGPEETRQPQLETNPPTHQQEDEYSEECDLHHAVKEMGSKTPEENENELEESLSQPLISEDVNFTVNGNLVLKEAGGTSLPSETTNTFICDTA